MVDVLKYLHLLRMFEYSFDMATSWDMSKHIQSTLGEHVKKVFTWIFYEIFFHAECSCSPNNIIVSYKEFLIEIFCNLLLKTPYSCFNISHKMCSLLNKNENLKVYRFC
jgi:hypothetical protein